MIIRHFLRFWGGGGGEQISSALASCTLTELVDKDSINGSQAAALAEQCPDEASRLDPAVSVALSGRRLCRPATLSHNNGDAFGFR